MPAGKYLGLARSMSGRPNRFKDAYRGFEKADKYNTLAAALSAGAQVWGARRQKKDDEARAEQEKQTLASVLAKVSKRRPAHAGGRRAADRQ